MPSVGGLARLYDSTGAARFREGSVRMMSLRTTAIALGLMLTLGVGCGDDDAEEDMGPADTGTDTATPPDMGTDTGPADTGPGDMGPDMAVASEAMVRLAHLVPDGGPVRMCIQATVGGAPAGPPSGPLPADPDPGIPFRGISTYLPFTVSAGISFEVSLYEDSVTDCATPGADPVLVGDVVVGTGDGEIEAGGWYTAALIGFAEPPSICGAAMDAECPSAEMRLFVDDGEVDAAMNKLRVLNAFPNSGGIDVCFNDGSATTEIFENISYGEASDYQLGPALTAGAFVMFVHDPANDCGTGGATAVGMLEIPTPATVSGGFPPGTVITDEYAVGQIVTLFGEGVLQPPTDPLPANFGFFVPWVDLPPAAAD